MSEKQISTATLELAKQIANDFTIDTSTGVADIKANSYVKNLPEGLTEEQVVAVGAYNTTYAAAASLALGQAGIPVLKANSDLAAVTASFPLTGTDTFDAKFGRSRKVPHKEEDGTATTIDKFGALDIGFTMHAANHKTTRGDLSRVKALLAAEADAALNTAMTK